MIVFSLFGSVFGMAEETIAFIIIFVPLAISMGYDSIVGICLCFFAAGLGFAGFALVVNSALYFVHERAWNRVSWAKDIASETEPVESAK